MNDDIKEIVHQALSAAFVNGYDFSRWDPFLVAEDLVQYDLGVEHLDAEDLVPYVKSWQESRVS